MDALLCNPGDVLPGTNGAGTGSEAYRSASQHVCCTDAASAVGHVHRTCNEPSADIDGNRYPFFDERITDLNRYTIGNICPPDLYGNGDTLFDKHSAECDDPGFHRNSHDHSWNCSRRYDCRRSLG